MTRDTFCTLDGHSVLLYGGDERQLVAYVVDWLAEHLAHEYPVMVALTPAHRREITASLQRFGLDIPRMEHRGIFICHDAERAAESIAQNGPPPWHEFESTFGSQLRSLRAHGPVRAYGEVADLLWRAAKREAAVELELYCNRLRGSVDFEMLCAYGIDIHGPEFAIGSAEGIVRTHGTVVPLRSGDSFR